MEKGEIVICEPEAEAVRQIFSMYLHGTSLSRTADAMTVPYNEGTAWDKHKVKRVLDNTRYLGNEGYPKLVNAVDHSAAKQLKTAKNTSTPRPCSEDIQSLKAAAFCRNCGGRFIREVNRHGTPRWKCVDSNCDNMTVLDDGEIKILVRDAMNNILNNPCVIHISQPLRPTPMTVTKLQNEINREMSKAKPGISETQNLLLTIAAEKYASCGNAQADLAFRAIFENHEPASQFDRGLFDSTVDKVFISATGAVSLRLKNGQTLPEP
jgi:hypothetical protein